ncbi:CYTH domain-containing protein [Roseiconus lacunae]|uniref:CYTH domain-containing protein n=1 Tax=Roseiconus lacunae TaxID=2605694 RepID=UPI001E636E4B|nr:CYTH domain-containing protein [Roseiconus lacunae]MCD0462095.1 CYTH domain-containing protein [Roseiconus lacunae]
MAVKDEFEYKLGFKSQHKFAVMLPAELALRQLRALCEILGIETGVEYEIKITDTYFDSSNGDLEKQGISTFRRRIENEGERKLVTFKADNKAVAEQNAVRRKEYEFECDDKYFIDLLNSPQTLVSHVKSHMGVDLTPVEVAEQLSIFNRRRVLPLSTRKFHYKFCYDRFYFRVKSTGKFSEHHLEIEIEREGDADSPDEQIEQLLATIERVLPGFEKHTKKKFNQGKKWAKSGSDKVRHIYSIGMDIVEFTQRSADIQKQMIQRLNKVCKEAFSKYLGSSSTDLTYLPRGDGMIVLLSSGPDKIIPILKHIQREIRVAGEEDSELQFSFRSAVHAGPVFDFTDVNENLSVAGDGINLCARLLERGESWHVLASESAAKTLGMRGGQRKLVHDVGEYSFKHGIKHRVFNVYDEEGFGFETPPLDA